MTSDGRVAHTAGPWSFGWETDARDWAIVTDAAAGIIANVNTETGPDSASVPATRIMPAVANARLIAAAPDLLEALRPFVDLGPQRGAWGVISKALDGMAPLTVIVTKAQMLAAVAALAKASSAS